jgi:hypothetical protein
MLCTFEFNNLLIENYASLSKVITPMRIGGITDGVMMTEDVEAFVLLLYCYKARPGDH